jgi:CBS-domain-containing membrane protein
MKTVKEVMTVDVLTVRPEQPVTVAARIMRNAGATGLLVVDASGHLAGILTEADLLNPAVADLSEIDDRHGSRNRSWTSTATDLISREVLGVSRDQPLAQAARPGFAHERIMLPSGVVTKRQEAIRLKRRAGKVPGASRVKSSVTSEANTAYPGLVPRFAYFAIDIAKRCERSRERRASPIEADNNNEDRGA